MLFRSYVLLARPVARHEVVLGKFVGILVTVAVFIALTAAWLLALVTVSAAEETVQGVQRSDYALSLVLGLVGTRASRLGLLAALLAAGGATLIVPRVRRALTLGAVLPLSLARSRAPFRASARSTRRCGAPPASATRARSRPCGVTKSPSSSPTGRSRCQIGRAHV